MSRWWLLLREDDRPDMADCGRATASRFEAADEDVVVVTRTKREGARNMPFAGVVAKYCTPATVPSFLPRPAQWSSNSSPAKFALPLP